MYIYIGLTHPDPSLCFRSRSVSSSSWTRTSRRSSASCPRWASREESTSTPPSYSWVSHLAFT